VLPFSGPLRRIEAGPPLFDEKVSILNPNFQIAYGGIEGAVLTEIGDETLMRLATALLAADDGVVGAALIVFGTDVHNLLELSVKKSSWANGVDLEL
jgi:hypothetical protein